MTEARLPRSIDHLVYAVPDLESGVSAIESLLGVAPTAGGQHLGRGTRNALVPLGNRSYLEIIGPDPEQPAPNEPRPFGLDELEAVRLVTWAVREGDLEARRKQALARGLDPGKPRSMSRRRPDGVLLEWRLMVATPPLAGGLAPFFIDWGNTPSPGEEHPALDRGARDLGAGCRLIGLRGTSPDPEKTRGDLDRLGIELEVQASETVALVAFIETAAGTVVLR